MLVPVLCGAAYLIACDQTTVARMVDGGKAVRLAPIDSTAAASRVFLGVSIGDDELLDRAAGA